MNDISIAAYNETFRQSSDPVYAHTLMRNVEELRTFNPKLKDSAGGEVNEFQLTVDTLSDIWNTYWWPLTVSVPPPASTHLDVASGFWHPVFYQQTLMRFWLDDSATVHMQGTWIQSGDFPSQSPPFRGAKYRTSPVRQVRHTASCGFMVDPCDAPWWPLRCNGLDALSAPYCPACRTTLVATRFRVAVICPIIQVPHCIRVFFYFVWFVFINHIFQFYYELCTYGNILDIYLS